MNALLLATKGDLLAFLAANGPLFVESAHSSVAAVVGEQYSIEIITQSSSPPKARIARPHTLLPTDAFPSVLGCCTINYQGLVMDCIDREFGIYNLDNQVTLFGCFQLAPLALGRLYTFYQCHWVKIDALPGIGSLIGPFPCKLDVVLVYCPIFSSMANSEQMQSMAYTGHWLDLLKSYLWTKKMVSAANSNWLRRISMAVSSIGCDYRSEAALFLKHFEECPCVGAAPPLPPSPVADKTLLDVKSARGLIETTKQGLRDTASYNHLIHEHKQELKGFVVFGHVQRKEKGTLELVDATDDSFRINISSDCGAALCGDAAIIEPSVIVELIPRLGYTNSWLTKSYLMPSFIPVRVDDNSAYVSGIIGKKYVSLRQPLMKEVVVIEVTGDAAGTYFLAHSDSFFGLLCGVRVQIRKHRDHQDFMMLKSADIRIASPHGAALSEDDAPLPLLIKDMQFIQDAIPASFVLKGRIDAITSLSIKLCCSVCKRPFVNHNCRKHGALSRDLEGLLEVQMAIKIVDRSGAHCSLLISDQVQFLRIFSIQDKCELYQYLKEPVLLCEEDFAFAKKYAERPVSPMAGFLKTKGCRGALWSFTFAEVRDLQCLTPKTVAKCDLRLELKNLIKFKAFRQVGSDVLQPIKSESTCLNNQ